MTSCRKYVNVLEQVQCDIWFDVLHICRGCCFTEMRAPPSSVTAELSEALMI